MIQDGLRVSGRLRITARDVRSGEIVAERDVRNLVVLAGRNLIRDLLTNATSARVTHFGAGTGSTAAAAGDTALETQVFRDTLTQTVASSGEILFRYYLPSTVANGSTLTEAGLFTASTGGVMFARTTYTGIVKTSSIGVSFDWTVTIGAS